MKMVRVRMVMSVVDVSTLYGSVERTTFLSYFPGSGQGEAAGSSGEQGRWVWVGGVSDQCSDKGGGGVCQDGEGHVGGEDVLCAEAGYEVLGAWLVEQGAHLDRRDRVQLE